MTDTKRNLPHGATPEQLEMFLERLMDIGATVVSCAKAAGISKRIVYELRRIDPRFAYRWEVAVEERCYLAFEAFRAGTISEGRMRNSIKSTKSVMARLKRWREASSSSSSSRSSATSSTSVTSSTSSEPSSRSSDTSSSSEPTPAELALAARLAEQQRAIQLEAQARAVYREQQDRIAREQQAEEERAHRARNFFSGDDMAFTTLAVPPPAQATQKPMTFIEAMRSPRE